MTIANAADNLKTFVTNGATTAFALSGLKFKGSQDLVVTFTPTGGAAVVWTQGVNYTLSGTPLAGSATLNASGGAPAAGSLTVYRQTPPRQELAVSSVASINSPEVEAALDDLSRQIGDVKTETARAIKVGVGATAPSLPSPEPGAALVGNADGTAFINSPIEAGNVTVAIAAREEAVAAAAAAAADATTADLAADAALAAGLIYANTTAGLAATANGGYFYVPSAEEDEVLILYRDNAGSAVEVKRVASVLLLRNSLSKADTATLWKRQAPLAGSSNLGTTTACVVDPAPHAGTIELLEFYAAATGTLKIKVWDKTGDVYTQIDERTVTVSSTGLQSFDSEDLTGLTIAEGNVVALRGSASGVLTYSPSPTGKSYFGASDAATGANSPSLFNNSMFEARITIGFSAQSVTAAAFAPVQSSIPLLEIAMIDMGSAIFPLVESTQAYLAALENEPSEDWQRRIDRLHRWLDVKGLRPKLDRLWCHITEHEQTAYVDLIDPDTVAMSPQGDTVWAAGKGIRGNGVDSYFDTNYNPIADALAYALRDAHLGVFSLSHQVSKNDFGSAVSGATAFVTTGTTSTHKASGTINRAYDATVDGPDSLLTVGHVVAVREGGVPKIYKDGVKVGETTNAVGSIPNQNLYLGALAGSAGAAFGFGSKRYAFTHAGGVLTAQDVKDLHDGLQHFVNASDDAVPIVAVCDGNSFTAGSGTGTAYPVQLSEISDYVVVNKGVGAQTTQNMASDADTDIDPYAAIAHVRPVVVAWEIRNDMYLNSISQAAAYANFKNYCLARKAAGFKVVAVTLAASFAGGTWNESARLAINTLMRNETPGTYWDALADVGADAAFQDYTNLTYYAGDNAHHTGAAKAIIAALVKAAIDGLSW